MEKYQTFITGRGWEVREGEEPVGERLNAFLLLPRRYNLMEARVEAFILSGRKHSFEDHPRQEVQTFIEDINRGKLPLEYRGRAQALLEKLRDR